MTDFEPILLLWRELESRQENYVLATIVSVEGSSYRKPGARMLLAKDGRRAGTVSGGCLEAEVARRAWWLTANGPVVERYSTLEDDGDLPYGSGCGGVVFILLERSSTARPLIAALERAFLARTPVAIATVVEGTKIGQRALAGATESADAATAPLAGLQDLAVAALADSTSSEQVVPVDGALTRVFVDYRPARPGLWIFGAGDDAKPLLHLARELGWFVAIADGRAHLATKARFPEADEICVLPMSDTPTASSAFLQLKSGDAAVLVTHSFEQDSKILARLLEQEILPAYIGVLGPQRRTREAIAEAARLLGRNPSPEWVEEWLERLYAPMGIDLGAETPASIALSIISEVQRVLTGASALPLRQVRAAKVPVTQD